MDTTKTSLPDRIPAIAWAAIIFLGQLPLLGTWCFSSDDGNTLIAADRAYEDFFLLGPPTSLGLAHPPFVYYLYGILLKLGSLRGVQLGIVAAHSIAHGLLVHAVRRGLSSEVALLASSLAFLSPASFVLYSQRFWEPSALPVCTVLAFFSFLRFQETRDRRWAAALVAALAVAASAHLNAVFLLCAPVLWLLLDLSGGHRRAMVFVAVLTPAAGALSLLVPAPSPGPVAALLNLLGPHRSEIGIVAGEGSGAEAWWAFFPEAVLFLLFVARAAFQEAGRLRRLLCLWLCLPLLLCLAEFAYLRSFRMHWLLILFPLAWIACADSLAWLCARLPTRRAGQILFTAAAVALLFSNGLRSLELQRLVAGNGGVSTRMAHLGTKLAVMERISAHPGIPRVESVVLPYRRNWYKEHEAWSFLFRLYRKERWRGEPGSFFYIHAEGSIASEPALAERIAREPGVQSETIASVTLFRSERALEGAGVPLQ